MSKVGIDNTGFEDNQDLVANGVRPDTATPVQATKTAENVNEEKKKPPLFFCSLIAGFPKTAFGLALGGHIFLILVSVILLVASYDLFPVNFTQVPLNIVDDDTYLRNAAWINRNEDSTLLTVNTSASVVGARTEIGDIIQIFYQASNVLTAERLSAINDLEQQLIAKPEWQNYCRIQSSVCALPVSLIRFFDGSLDAALNDMTFSNIPGNLYTASQNANLKPTLDGLIGKSAVITATEATTSVSRTVMYAGTPLAGHDLTSDSLKDQLDEIQTFQVNNFRGTLNGLLDSGLQGMTVNFYSDQLFAYDIVNQVVLDLLLAAGSFTFIYLFMLFQTRSLLLTSLAISSILTSFLGANLIYRVVFDFRYFGIFHVLSIFIILGIGADNIFVFYDTWRATERENHDKLVDRLSSCYRRASSSMTITSLTTFTAFLANAASPLLAVSSFGIFSAVLVLVNFMSAIIFFPTVVIVHHLYWEQWPWPCFKPCDKIKRGPCAKKEDDDNSENKGNAVVRFFSGPFHKAVTHKWLRWVFIAFCGGLLTFFLVFATKLEISEKGMQLFKDGNNYQEALELNRDAFLVNLDERNVKVIIAFGLKNQDFGSCHSSDVDCKGVTVWDESFDLNPKPAQRALLTLCEKIRTLPTTQHTNLLLQRLPVSNDVDLDCFISAMDTYMTNDGTTYTPNLDVTLPTSELKLNSFFPEHTTLYDAAIVQGADFYRYFETIKSYWLNNRYQGSLTDDYRTYSVLIGETRDALDTSPILSDADQLYGTRLRYAAIEIRTTLLSGTKSYEDGLVIYDAWEAFVTDEVSNLPPSLQGGFQFTPATNAWHIFKVQRTLAQTAFQGILIGILLTFVVLTIATTNIIISFMATVTIGFVTMSIVGIIPLFGWKLSVIESLNLSLVVGLAVDYVVHLSESYHSSKQEGRVLKVKDMLEAMGLSVVSGAFSTLGAAAFMMGAQIQFFLQFGIFVFFTIGFSLIFSLFLFTPVLGILGPEGHFGSLSPVVIWVYYKIIGRKKMDVHCETCDGKGFHGLKT